MAENIIPDLKNGPLVEAMIALRKNETPKTQSDFVTEAMKASYFIPAEIIGEDGKPVAATGKIELSKDTKLNFTLIKNTEGEGFFPVFTDINEFKKWSKLGTVKTIVVGFHQAASLVRQKDPAEVKGFVINPLGHNLIFTRESLKNLENAIRSGRPVGQAQEVKVLFGKPVNIPDSVLDSFRKTLSKHSEVNAVYFLMMKQNEEESYLFVFDTEGEMEKAKKTADSFCASARLFLSKYPVVSAPLKSPIGEHAPKVTEPFYTKE